jgi:hypothetical protein
VNANYRTHSNPVKVPKEGKTTYQDILYIDKKVSKFVRLKLKRNSKGTDRELKARG